MTDKEQIMIDTNEYFLEVIDDGGGTIGYTVVYPEGLLRDIIKQNKKLARKTQECNELKIENEELNNRMAEVIYRATGGRLSYSNYTLDAIEKAFNDQLEILSDQKVEEETKELNQKLYLAQNEIHSKTEYIQEQRDIIKKLEQECEELKLKCLGNRNDYLCERQVTKRYRKALEEIEEIVKGMRSVFIEEISITASQLNDRIYRESTARFRQILNIINKAKGQGE